MIAGVPEHPIHEAAPFRELEDIFHELARLVPADRAPCIARRDFGDPERFVAPFTVVGVHGGDDIRGLFLVLMDVVRGEEIFAVARREEVFQPRAIRVSGHRGDEFGAGARLGEEGFDGVCGFLRRHRRGVSSVRIVGFVEGEEPCGRVRPVDEIHGVGDVAGKGHHGDVVLGGARRGVATGHAHLEGDPVGGGGDFVVHGGLEAAVEADAFELSAVAGAPAC